MSTDTSTGKSIGTRVDYGVVTGRQQRVWGLGDYGRVGALLSWMGESLVREIDVRSGERVLDVAAGTGNASLPAARRFAEVLATDYVPELLAVARSRAEVDGLVLRTQVADAQALPFEDGAFDVVLSTIGAMFAPDQDAVAREMLRVCRSGGRIGMASWTPDSVVGDMFRAVAARVPPPPGVRPAVAWGEEERVAELLGAGCSDLRTTRRSCAWRYPSTTACLEHFTTWYGPVIAAFTAAGGAGRADLAADLRGIFEARNTADDGTLALEADYLEVIGVRA